MAHGGKREGAGRPAGAATVRTREIAERAVLDGLTPLEVMLFAMRTHADGGDWDKAAEVAKYAAPYIHPRLSSLSVATTGPTVATATDAELDALIHAHQMEDRLALKTRGGA